MKKLLLGFGFAVAGWLICPMIDTCRVTRKLKSVTRHLKGEEPGPWPIERDMHMGGRR